MQPPYYDLEVKIAARKENIDIFRKITNLSSIPSNKIYLTLCNEQPPDHEGTEIVQLEKLGFLKKEQFYGIDRDEHIIAKNKKWHPNAHWFCGEWVDVIKDIDNKKLSVIYLDTTTFADNNTSANIVKSTMPLCPKGALLLINVMLSSPYDGRKFEPSDLINKINKNIPSFELDKWKREIPNYTYSATGKTKMITYIFVKEHN